MADLRVSLDKAGFQNVQTYIQSGNVAFAYKKAPQDGIARKVEEIIKKDFGYDVPVIVFDGEYLKTVIADNPFMKRGEDETKLHITFLAENPDQDDMEKVTGLDYPPDEILMGDKAVYLFCPDGYGRTKYNNTFLEKKLKVTATTRNWKTCNVLAEMC